MCLLAVLGSQGIVVKYAAAIFFRRWIVMFKEKIKIIKIVVFIAQRLVRASKKVKQIIQMHIPSGRKQTSWLFTSVAQDTNSKPPGRESSALTTRPSCLQEGDDLKVQVLFGITLS